MMLTKRSNLVQEHNSYEELKQPSLVANDNGTSKTTEKLKNHNRKGKKLLFELFRKTLSTTKALPSLAYFTFECLVSTVIIVYFILLLSPMMLVYNVLKLLERKWVSHQTGAVAMTGQDALWLQDQEKNRLIINSVMVLEGKNVQGMVDGVCGILKRCIEAKKSNGELAYPRFTKCIRKGIFQYFLEESTNFNMPQHVYEYKGESPRSREEMQDLLSRLYSEDLPFNIPPWRFILIPTTYKEDEVVLLFRVHHGLADGISLTKFLTMVFPDKDVVERKLVKFSASDRLLMWTKATLVGARILLGKLLRTPDKSIIHGCELSGIKRVAWSDPIDLQVIKRIKSKTGTTVNDVMMACVSMSFHDYFKSKGVTNPPDITATIPVDVRTPDYKVVLENNFTVVSLKLPVSVTDIHEQLYTTKARMDDIKHSGEAFVMTGGANFTVQYMPEPITNLWNKPIANKHSLVLSNVPGPTTRFTVAGHQVKALFFWPPQRDLVGVGVGIYSYGGKVIIGVQGDVSCLPNPQVIVETFESKLAELEASYFKSTQTEVDSGIEIH